MRDPPGRVLVDYRYIGDHKAIVTLKNGLHLAVPMQDPFIGCPIALSGELDPLLESLVKDRVFAGSRCVNVGANVGYFTVLMAQLCGATGQVFAFEPNPKNVEMLVFNLYLNRLNRFVHLYRAAVSNARGTAKFVVHQNYSDGWIAPEGFEKHQERARFLDTGLFVWEGNTYQEAEIHEVPVVTLDYVLGNAGAFDFILCDAEGFDINVLMGAHHVIKNSGDRLTVAFEWNAGCFDEHFSRDLLRDFFAMLQEAGFVTLYGNDDRWVPFDYAEVGLPVSQCNVLCERTRLIAPHRLLNGG